MLTGNENTEGLVEIVVDNEILAVSPWSIRDGMYIQGLDSHFLVSRHCTSIK